MNGVSLSRFSSTGIEFAVWIFCLLASALSANAEELVPKIAIEKPMHDFGKVAQGTVVNHAFKVKNIGTAPLIIHRILADCGCTVATAQVKEIAPQEESEIAATFNTAGFYAYKTKTIRIYTNDPKNATAVIGFRGTVVTDVDVDPPRLYFGNVNKGDPVEKSVEVRFSEASSANILDIVALSDDILVERPKEQQPDARSQSFIVRLRDNVPIGLLKSKVVIKTTSAERPVINLPVFARVEGDLKWSPSNVSFGLLEGPLARAIARKVRLSNGGSQAVQILSASTSNKQIGVSFTEKNKGREFELSIELLAGANGTLKEQVKILTNHPDPQQRELSIPVYAIVASKGG
ncbi:MAG: DUF1573 domain-containing protein [Deltaproteobacteria bacterium]|nr:DUF1573 domain-containing protein [Deltaproteobacteria bacterium]